MNSHLRNFSMSAGLLLLLVVCASAYNDDKPIYKWSPLIFRSLKKDKGTRQSLYWQPKTTCSRERSACYLGKSFYGLISEGYLKPCCDGLVCERIRDFSICLRPNWETNEVHPIY